MVKAMDCRIVVSEFVLQSRYYVHFRVNTLEKGMNPLILPAMGWIVPLMFFSENSFGIKQPTKVDMPLNKETKPNQNNIEQVLEAALLKAAAVRPLTTHHENYQN